MRYKDFFSDNDDYSDIKYDLMTYGKYFKHTKTKTYLTSINLMKYINNLSYNDTKKIINLISIKTFMRYIDTGKVNFFETTINSDNVTLSQVMCYIHNIRFDTTIKYIVCMLNNEHKKRFIRELKLKKINGEKYDS